MHGGQVDAQSKGQGLGSEFVVRLPILNEASQPQASAAEEQTSAPVSALRILVVDDNRDAADSLSEMLELMGNETRTAYDGREGVDMAGDYLPDVVLLDIGLPKLNGYDACRLIREQPWGKSLVVIALTGWGQDKDRQLSREAGFDYHLVKPVDPQALMAIVAGLDVGRDNR
jgi:DNA-binding response OmpR family regulator